MNEDLISVVVPIYNVEQYLAKCIDSIIKQTYKNLEIILIDDGSKDNCGKICDEYANIDNRIRVIHKKNGGVSSARNIGLENSNGQYISFIDSDDFLEKNMYEIMINEFKNNNKLDIVVCGVNDIDENNNIIRETNINNNLILNKEEFLKEILDEEKINAVVWNKLIKKEIIKDNRFNKEIAISEDLDFFINAIEKINYVKIINDRLYNWLIRKDSVTKTKFNDKWKQEIDVCKNIINITKNRYKKLNNTAIKRYIRINITCYIKVIKFDKNNVQAKKYLRNNIKTYILNYIFNIKVSIKLKIYAILIYLKII